MKLFQDETGYVFQLMPDEEVMVESLLQEGLTFDEIAHLASVQFQRWLYIKDQKAATDLAARFHKLSEADQDRVSAILVTAVAEEAPVVVVKL